MKKDLLNIIKHYGIEKQKRKFGEETDELKEAIIIYELKKSVEYEIPLTELICSKEHIAEEIADVLVMLEQFRLYYGISMKDVKNVMDFKINRQLGRIKEENEKV